MYESYSSPNSIDEALATKARYGSNVRFIAGGTDLLIELERGRRAPDGEELSLIDLTRIPGLADIVFDGSHIHLGPLVTHNQCAANQDIVDRAFPLARACWEVGAPQIRNRATVAGNIITASPANDSIVPLTALDATITVRSAGRGERAIPIQEFNSGFRQVDLQDDEMLTRISFSALNEHHEGVFVKLGLRRTQAISVVSAAIIVEQDGGADAPILSAAISLGAVAPVIIRASEAEAFLVGKVLSEESIAEAARLAARAATPIDDIRGSAAYRSAMVDVLVKRGLQQMADGRTRAGWLEHPVLLRGNTDGKWPVASSIGSSIDPAIVNGVPVHLSPGMTLLDSLREAGYVGVKEGCAEGECGACTVFLDGMAVMACLVPSERAAGSEVVTVEGLGDSKGGMHPFQSAMVRSGGVQCGYCTPGFVMSAVKLLEEIPYPTDADAQQAFAGNLCRCTGYCKILDAVQLAANEMTQE